MTVRIIPRLDVKGPNLVKGIHLEGLRVLGRPPDFARLYYEQGADELLYMDVVASLYGRNSLLEMISRTAKDVFIPITVGGGLRKIEDNRDALRAGADKVSLNTAAIARPELIEEAATQFGSSTIVVSIEAIRKPDGRYEAYTDNGRETTGIDPLEWALRMAGSGAGEIMVTSIDREGTGKGLDIELTRQIVESTTGAVAVGKGGSCCRWLSPIPVPHSSPWLRFQSPLIEPDMQISRIRLSDEIMPSPTESSPYAAQDA